MNERLPIAGGNEVRREATALLRRYRGSLAVVLGLNALAAVAGLVGPWLLGQLVEAVKEGTTTGYVDRLIALLAASVLAQTVLTWFARRASFVLSETVFAELRENFMRQVLALPLSVVERAGTGDLVSRTTADVDTLARTVRFAIPETLISAVTILLTVVAAVVVSPVAALSCIVGLPAIADRDALVPAPRAAGVPLGARRVRDDDGNRRRDRRRRPHRGRALAWPPPSAADRRRPRRRVSRRAADALPPHRPLPDGRGRVRAARGGRARLGRLARLRGARLDRRGDGGRALRAAARRPGRPADLVARRDPGRRDVVRPARRRDEGSGRPGRHRRGARARAAVGLRRALRLHRRTATCSTASTSISSRASGSPLSGRRGPGSRPLGAYSPGFIRRAPAASRSATSGSSTSSSRRCGARWRS